MRFDPRPVFPYADASGKRTGGIGIVYFWRIRHDRDSKCADQNGHHHIEHYSLDIVLPFIRRNGHAPQ